MTIIILSMQHDTWYLSQPPQPAVVYFFVQTSAPFSTKKTKIIYVYSVASAKKKFGFRLAALEGSFSEFEK